jgi:hypothetical protein
MNLGMPSITIRFIEKGVSAIQRGQRGVVGLILRGAVPGTNPVVVTTESDIVGTWSNANKQYVKDALVGYTEKPKKIICFFVAADAEDYSTALDYFSSQYVDYVAIPTVATDELESSVVSWVKNEWENHNQIIVVLPDVAGDFEGIVNFTTDNIKVGSNTYTSEQYTPRIAGMLAGTPMTMSATYANLDEVDDVDRLTKEQQDAAVAAGKFILFFDAEKVKTGTAVTSFTTTTSEKGDSFKKIKLVDTMRQITRDIYSTVRDSYIGKYPNTYDNKVMLCNAIMGYFKQLTDIVENYSIDIDAEANATYLESKGIDTSDMTTEELRHANTGDKVYLTAKMNLVDVMENIDIPIYI